jgi:hypothetical protein
MNCPSATADDVDRIADALFRLAADERLASELPVESVQRLLAAATRAYVAHREAGARVAPFAVPEGAAPMTATEAVATASEMLRALDIEVFELALWQSQGGL